MKQQTAVCPWPRCGEEVTVTLPNDQALIRAAQDDSRRPWPRTRSQEVECPHCHETFCIWTL